MITVGLDFGTHQTKICIEDKDGVECKYTFMKHMDANGKFQYTLPSIINICPDGKLQYGYISHKLKGEIIRYFKQGAFRTIPYMKMTQEDALYYSCWYLAYILFDLEEKFGQNFAIQMGAPTDGGHYETAKQISVRILASAYRLVEDVFKNDKRAFLNTPIANLKKLTVIEQYSISLKDNYGILVFPEAYACLKPLTSKGKIADSIGLMVDIGGGTTDISLFTIAPNVEDVNMVSNGKDRKKERVPVVYDFHSIDMGLNFLTNALQKEKENSIQSSIDNTEVRHKGILHTLGEIFSNHNNKTAQLSNEKITSNVESDEEFDISRKEQFTQEIRKYVSNIDNRIRAELKKFSSFTKKDIDEALSNRPIIYCGGGSTFKTLRKNYFIFTDRRLITHSDWDIKYVEDAGEIINLGLIPILSTAYGLAISVKNDNITQKSFKNMFDYLREVDRDRKRQISGLDSQENSRKKHSYTSINDYDSYDAWK